MTSRVDACDKYIYIYIFRWQKVERTQSFPRINELLSPVSLDAGSETPVRRLCPVRKSKLIFFAPKTAKARGVIFP